ncbi:MAG: N-formylglutamate amidohydrolase [Caulobacteraceae bacterium]|nr:N-formylglutamate amidohydrolase [Caulobacteraceae bacterium]
MSLLTPADPPPFIIEHPGASGPVILVGDHAGRRVPLGLADLGLPPEAFERHIAWDIGVAGVGARLAELLDAPFIRQTYSRLVIDCNRDPSWPESIPPTSDGTAIPGNVSAGDTPARRDEIFAPYHAAISARIDAVLAAGRRPLLVAVHSFTPALSDKAPRPWRFGVVHDGASALSRAVLAELITVHGEAVVGDNLPYALEVTSDYTIPTHAIARGLDYLELEIRQDTIADAAAQTAMAEGLAPVLKKALASLTR